jgi:hypothetical protein
MMRCCAEFGVFVGSPQHPLSEIVNPGPDCPLETRLHSAGVSCELWKGPVGTEWEGLGSDQVSIADAVLGEITVRKHTLIIHNSETI